MTGAKLGCDGDGGLKMARVKLGCDGDGGLKMARAKLRREGEVFVMKASPIGGRVGMQKKILHSS